MSDKPVIVYLAHPFSGDPGGNVQRVTHIARMIIAYSERSATFYAPLVPHLALSVYEEHSKPCLRRVTEALSSALVRASHELWVVCGTISKGMELEIEAARAHGLPVRSWGEVVRLIPAVGAVPTSHGASRQTPGGPPTASKNP